MFELWKVLIGPPLLVNRLLTILDNGKPLNVITYRPVNRITYNVVLGSIDILRVRRYLCWSLRSEYNLLGGSINE